MHGIKIVAYTESSSSSRVYIYQYNAFLRVLLCNTVVNIVQLCNYSSYTAWRAFISSRRVRDSKEMHHTQHRFVLYRVYIYSAAEETAAKEGKIIALGS